MDRDKWKQESAVIHAVTDDDSQRPVSALELLLITRAYNRKEIPFEEWLKRTKEWAEKMNKQYGEGF